MLWPREEFHAAYGQIKHDGIQTGGCSVLILVAMDVDALCACEIVTSLLKADFLSYTMLAVKGYEDLKRIRYERIRGPDGSIHNDDLRSVILINCGAIVNVSELLALPPTARCYILDSHRPIHLANIYDANQQIVVFDDGAQSLDDFPADGSDIENDDFNVSDDDEDDDDEEEEEDDDVEDDEGTEEEDEGEAEVEFTPAAKPEETAGADATDDEQADEEKLEETEDLEKLDEQAASADEQSGTEKRKRSDSDDNEEESPKKLKEASELSEDDEGDDKPTKSAEPLEEVEEDENTKQAKRKRREEILRYYRGSFYGAPAASIAFELAQQMNASRRELLWYAIIGLTQQFLLEQIDADNYNLMVHRFQDEVLALDSSSGESGGADGDNSSVMNPAYDHGKIEFEEEYRFMLYRHWSLYESMYYSDYVASKLGLWMDRARRFGARVAGGGTAGGAEGETTLHVFLARMGFSLKQSQQKFSYMPLEMKQMLREKTQEVAPDFGLDDLFYGSFKRHFAFQYQLCAADAVYGLQALLEAPESYISNVFKAENHHQTQQNGPWAHLLSTEGANKPAAREDGDENAEEEQPFWQQNFILAHTALSCRSVESSKLMESGVKVAMELKQAIVRVGISIMERKLLVRVKHFRYVCLNIPEREQELFANANVLTQLALFLLNVHRASGKWGGKQPVKRTGDAENDTEEEALTTLKPIVPLVLITRNPAQNCFLVVGLTCPNSAGEVHRNTLGTAFKLAAGETGANFRQDGFTSAVMEIQMDDIQYFVEQLHNVLDA
ncbi:TPA: hypothetical protein N0F65_006022 [Lagenidium giganteum]|uniref:Cell division control protein 45 n=1 Tax=Lagenidium giganteum TaxID=4803 RepID=A0AAV2Z925_9STRA|nr:TPA: hypothetical protein N0F65_006022 [Lagenidium giganteum]